jgi:hypothetical protein
LKRLRAAALVVIMATFLIVMALARMVSAEPSRVVILRGAADDARSEEAANRLRAELAAAGFDVVMASPPADAQPRAAMESAAIEARAFAAVMILPAMGGAAADVWVVDRVTGKTLIRTVQVGGPSAPADLAVRAVELVQASLLEATAAPKAGPASAPAAASASAPASIPEDVRSWMEPEREPPPRLFTGLGIEAGAGLLQSTGGIGPAFGPVLRLSLGIRAGFAGRLAFAGPAVGPDLTSSLGSASVRQELVALDLIYAFESPGVPVALVLSLGGGGYHLHATGAPNPPYAGDSDEVWSALADIGVGGALRFSSRAALLLDVHTLFTAPRPVVTLAGQELGSAGRPSFLVTLGIVASLL